MFFQFPVFFPLKPSTLGFISVVCKREIFYWIYGQFSWKQNGGRTFTDWVLISCGGNVKTLPIGDQGNREQATTSSSSQDGQWSSDFPLDLKLYAILDLTSLEWDLFCFFIIPPCTRVNGVLESTQVVFGWRWGYILDTSPVQCNWRDNLQQQAIPLDCLACLELVFCGAKLVTLCVSFNPIPSIIYPAWKPYLLVLSSAVSDTHCLKVRSLK